MSDFPLDHHAGSAETQCRRHPDRVATLVCTRCGDYICVACRHAGIATVLCESCATRTGEVSDHPPGLSWGIGAVIGASSAAFKQSLGTGLGLGLIALFLGQLPLGIGMSFIQSRPAIGSEMASFIQRLAPTEIFLGGLAITLAYALLIWISFRVMAAQVFAASAGFYRKESRISECWDRSRGCVWPILLNLALLPTFVGVMPFAFLAAIAVPMGAQISPVGSFIVVGIGMMAFAVVAVIWLLRVGIVVTPIVALERPGNGTQSTQRAWALTRGKMLEIFVLVIVLVILAVGVGLVSFGVTMAAMFIMSPPAPGQVPTPSFGALALAQVISAILQLFISYVNTCVTVGIYYGLRTLQVPARNSRQALQPLAL